MQENKVSERPIPYTVIDGREMPLTIGARIRFMKEKGVIPTIQKEEWEKIWHTLTPLTFKEICEIENIEWRRIAFTYLSIEDFAAQADPRLVSSETLKKTTTWITHTGEVETIEYDDTYELYAVKRNVLFPEDKTDLDLVFVKFKDTSTERMYQIWIDPISVWVTNNPDKTPQRDTNYLDKINPIAAIAWTMMTKVPLGETKDIIRQGDLPLAYFECDELLDDYRHRTEQEYRTLLTLES